MQVTSSNNFPVIAARLKRLPKAMRPAVRRGLEQGLHLTAGVVQKDYLSGPRPLRLGVVTTRLRNSISIRVKDDGRSISGRIGTNVKYAAWHEFGFRGIVQVRAHTRVTHVQRGGRTFGIRAARGPIHELSSGRIVGHKRSGKDAVRRLKKGSVGIQMVKGHSRTVRYMGRPFIRPALVKTRRTIIARIYHSLRRAVRAQNQGGRS